MIEFKGQIVIDHGPTGTDYPYVEPKIYKASEFKLGMVLTKRRKSPRRQVVKKSDWKDPMIDESGVGEKPIVRIETEAGRAFRSFRPSGSGERRWDRHGNLLTNS